MYLLDTMVISELRRKHCNHKVKQWRLSHLSIALFLSVASLFEISRGICAQEKSCPEFARELYTWIAKLKTEYNDRILLVTEEIAMEWGRISFLTCNYNLDNLIAATAKVHNLTVVTRNLRHFQLTGVPCVNPWE